MKYLQISINQDMISFDYFEIIKVIIEIIFGCYLILEINIKELFHFPFLLFFVNIYEVLLTFL